MRPNIARKQGSAGRITRRAHASIRAAAGPVSSGIDAQLSPLIPTLAERSSHEAVLEALHRARGDGHAAPRRRYGNLVDGDWTEGGRYRPTPDLRPHGAAQPEKGRVFRNGGGNSDKDALPAELIGSGLVLVGGALGRHMNPRRTLVRETASASRQEGIPTHPDGCVCYTCGWWQRTAIASHWQMW
jgi:hypothetical protein